MRDGFQRPSGFAHPRQPIPSLVTGGLLLLIGGILDVMGFPEFLENYGEAAAAFNSVMDELAALAEAALRESGAFAVVLEPHGAEED